MIGPPRLSKAITEISRPSLVANTSGSPFTGSGEGVTPNVDEPQEQGGYPFATGHRFERRAEQTPLSVHPTTLGSSTSINAARSPSVEAVMKRSAIRPSSAASTWKAAGAVSSLIRRRARLA